MPLDTTRSHPSLNPELQDDLREIKHQGFKRYASAWTRIDASASGSFTHGLLEVPHVVDVLEATDSQGTGSASAASVTTTKTGTLITVANAGTARFFRVRAF